MVSLFFVISLILTILCLIKFAKEESKGSEEESKGSYTVLEFYRDLFITFAGISFILLIWILILINRLGTGHIIDDRIAMYEEENASIEESIDTTVKAYMDFESSTYRDLKEKDTINLGSSESLGITPLK